MYTLSVFLYLFTQPIQGILCHQHQMSSLEDEITANDLVRFVIVYKEENSRRVILKKRVSKVSWSIAQMLEEKSLCFLDRIKFTTQPISLRTSDYVTRLVYPELSRRTRWCTQSLDCFYRIS